jgi:hypothetical protein
MFRLIPLPSEAVAFFGRRRAVSVRGHDGEPCVALSVLSQIRTPLSL